MTQQFLTVSEVSEMLKLTPRTIYQLAWKRQIPSYKPSGGRLLFDVDEILEWIQRGRRATHEELHEQADAALNGRGR